MTNGEDVPTLTLQVLREIRQEARHTNQRLDQTNQRLGALERTTALGFERVTDRIEHLRDFIGACFRDHEARIQGLEQRLSALESR